jgi:uncharacterized membrane protein YraQ (UPF0718 family)
MAVEAAGAAPVRTASWRHAGLVLIALGGLAALLRAFDPSSIAGVQSFFIVFSSLLIEAVPFILLGATVSAAIAIFVPTAAFERVSGLPRALQLPAAGLAGFAFPVCECGSVPVARRLASRGLSPAAAVTFMLAAPIVNPVVLASTLVAYRGRDVMWPMVAGRAGLGFLVALGVGWTVSGINATELLRDEPGSGASHSHPEGGRLPRFFGHLADDFIFMGRFLVVGAAAAALLQTLVPQSIVARVADTPVVNLLALMALAFVLSLCSESDAFVAASFVQFGVGAQLAFLVFGPLVDTKLAVLYSATFRRGFFRALVVVAATVTLAGTLWIEVFFG